MSRRRWPPGLFTSGNSSSHPPVRCARAGVDRVQSVRAPSGCRPRPPWARSNRPGPGWPCRRGMRAARTVPSSAVRGPIGTDASAGFWCRGRSWRSAAVCSVSGEAARAAFLASASFNCRSSSSSLSRFSSSSLSRFSCSGSIAGLAALVRHDVVVVDAAEREREITSGAGRDQDVDFLGLERQGHRSRLDRAFLRRVNTWPAASTSTFCRIVSASSSFFSLASCRTTST